MAKTQIAKQQRSDGKPAKTKLSDTELKAQQGAELPDREAMSLVNANLAAPINAAVAANVLSDNSIAAASAQQTTPITQGIGSGGPPKLG